MDKTKRKLILESVTFGCAVIGTVMSVLSLEGASLARVLGVSAGSFGAGAALTCLIGTVKRRRLSKLVGPVQNDLEVPHRPSGPETGQT